MTDHKTASKTHSFWFWKWISLSVSGALIATVVDSFLLQRRYYFFTGGFLSAIYTKSAGEVIAFFLTSLLTDASVVVFFVSFGLWFSSFTRLRGLTRTFMVLATAVSPIFIIDFFLYELASYIGDVFNLVTMFDLSGKNVLEILAVGSPHLISSSLTVLEIAVPLVGGLWVLNKVQSGPTEERYFEMSYRSILVSSVILFFLGLGTSSFARLTSDVLDHGLRKKPSGRLLGNVVSFVSDFDQDGYGLLHLPSDPDPFDSKIFPYAVEIPGNGIDENGIGGDLPVKSAQYDENAASKKAWKSKPDIVFFMLESIRADVVGSVYNGKQVTPVLNALAARGISAEHAYSHNGYTIQSRHHVFSGSLANLRPRSLIDDFKTNGYQVAYFSGQDESFGGPRMEIGFERADISYDARVDPDRRFTTFTSPGSIGLPLSVLREKITTFLHERSSEKPLFLYINFIDTHFPYHHAQVRPLISDHVLKRGEIGPDRVKALQGMYLNTTANIDAAIGEVLEEVKNVLGQAPAVLVTSDHGESLFDGGFLGHGYLINDVQTRIPLIVSGLPVVIKEPFGQSALREALSEALSHPLTKSRAPVLEVEPSGRVFQYTGGTLRRPGQIAFTRLDSRMVYRFKTGHVKINSGKWQNPESL
ncbi:MAG: sulfatase-like hydrolase/transferase, partial [Nitrospiria bacterium]